MKSHSLLMMSACFLTACEVACAASPVAPSPCDMEFKLIASRRYMLDNGLVISELVPGTVVRPSVQNPFLSPIATRTPTE